jgi:hypothetical protein
MNWKGSGRPVSGPRFEVETSQIRIRSLNHLTTKFGTEKGREVRKGSMVQHLHHHHLLLLHSQQGDMVS